MQLFNLENDIGEKKNVLKAYPELVERLTSYLADFADDIAPHSRLCQESKTAFEVTTME